MVEMSMRAKLIGVIERGRDKDHSPETVVDAVLEVLREADEGMLEAGSASFGEHSVGCTDGAGAILPEFAIHPWQAMIDHARNDGKE